MPMERTQPAAGVPAMSMPRIMLHLEGLGLLASVVVLYAYQGYSWLAFFLLLLAPDLAAIGYLAGPRIGAVAYNLVHTIIGPLVVGLAGLVGDSDLAMQAALIWMAHIGMDRAVGYGLKYTEGFKMTHMGRI